MIVDADRAPHPQRVGVLTKAGALNVQGPKDTDEEAERDRYRRIVSDHKE